MEKDNEITWEDFKKIGIPIIVIAICLIFAIFFVYTFFMHGNIKVMDGKDIVPITSNNGYWTIYFYNNGLASSKHVILNVSFASPVIINKNGLYVNRQPDVYIVKENSIFAMWNKLDRYDNIYFYVPVTSTENLYYYKTPISVTVWADGELVYIYP